MRRSVIAIVTALLAGCTAIRPYPPLNLPPSARLVEVWDAAASPVSGSMGADAALRPVTFSPQNVLVLSGGGANGAFTAGVLKGWTASGTRPQFDVVTGISTGALIAPFAFLGPEYDEALAESYTKVRDRDIFNLRRLTSLPWSDSLADSTPLRRRIEAEVTSDLLAKVARAHADGRRLYVGTTNLDTKRLVIWDLGAIAAGDHPRKLELFRKILLASASFPGLLPPMAFNVEVDGRSYTELHVDGGVSASLFLQPGMLGERSDPETPEHGGDMTVYVIVAGKVQPLVQPVERRLFNIAGESLEGILQTRLEGDLLKTYLLTRYAGAQFALAAVPQEFPQDDDSMSFDPRVMRALFDNGYRFAASGDWRPIPPGLTLEEQLPPRRGLRFTVEGVE